jgi:hypothetical protein
MIFFTRGREVLVLKQKWFRLVATGNFPRTLRFYLGSCQEILFRILIFSLWGVLTALVSMLLWWEAPSSPINQNGRKTFHGNFELSNSVFCHHIEISLRRESM